jgi:hypothetical protein
VVFVIPAQAGNQFILVIRFPACAGMTWLEIAKVFRTHSGEAIARTTIESEPAW